MPLIRVPKIEVETHKVGSPDVVVPTLDTEPPLYMVGGTQADGTLWSSWLW